ncbi:MAG: twin-arginine translocation signal domain-containing protein [Anaerolineae bacterium]|nr:twin-arginine translocation signal domain-containing protein [Anaerolineae bacterium]
MTAISRRDFLRVCGVALAGAALPPVRAGLGAPRVAFAGRALETAIIRAAPRPDASILRTVHPDRVLSLAEAVAGWFAARDPDGGLTGAAARGFVAARQVQPMAPYTPPAVVTAADGPFWAEVIAPVTVARRWPLPDAPSLGRVGYGGVFRVVDTQADDWDCVWYRNADAAGGGWVQALHARPLDPDALASIDAGVAGKRVVIDAARCALTAWAGDRAVFAAPVAVPASPAGAARRLPAGGVCDDKRAAQRGRRLRGRALGHCGRRTRAAWGVLAQ